MVSKNFQSCGKKNMRQLAIAAHMDVPAQEKTSCPDLRFPTDGMLTLHKES